MFRKQAIISSILLLTTFSWAGIYRHDKKVSEYETLAAMPQFNCVGQLFRNGKFYSSCVFIRGKFVLSSAHCFVEYDTKIDTIHQGNSTIYANLAYNKRIGIPLNYYVVFDGVRYDCRRIIIYPGYLDSLTEAGLDIALLELKQPVKDIAPAVINGSFNEVTCKAVGVGYGAYGPADKPDQIVFGPKKLAGENIVDSIGGYKLKNLSTVMYCDFDHPDSTSFNKLGDVKPLSLEYICSGGDSGGGLFKKNKDGWVLIGICQGANVDVDQLVKAGYYGQVMQWVRISVFRRWITKIIKRA
jgi:hypothetical protein